MLNIYDTHTLLMAVQQILPAPTFLRDRYFPTNDATDIFSTTDVLIEYRNGSKKLAPFVSPRKGGVTVLREGSHMDRYTPPTIAPKRTMTVDDLNQRGFGEALLSQLTPAERQAALMLMDFDELTGFIVRREEAMAAETLLTNGCVMKHIVDDDAKPIVKQIQFYEGADNPAQYTPTVDWNESGADILGDIYAVCEILAAKGLPSSDLIVSSDVGAAILANETIQKLLDNRNINIGGVDPQTLPSGVTKLARLNANGHVVDVLMYSASYTGDDDKDHKFIPNGKAIITAPACGRTLYGAVSQVEQSDGAFHTYTGRRVPKYYSDARGNVRTLTLTSQPIMVPNHKDSWITINAINA